MKTVYILLLFALIGCVQSTSLEFEFEWETFKLEHQKQYDSEREELLRKQIFKDSKELIERHNARYAAGEETYKMGITEFADMTDKEFTDKMLPSMNMTLFPVDRIYVPDENLELPKSVDWRNKNAITPVRHQGQCGSCWAFATVATLESQHFLKTGRLDEFSEQNLVDCSSQYPYTNNGCHGGQPIKALRYVKANGINTRSSYPYEAHQSRCRFKKDHIGAVIKGIESVKYGDEVALMRAVAEKGPIAVSFDAQNFKRLYISGISTKPCSGEPFYHAVLLAGYGNENGQEYWLLKNSWGKRWGEAGYFRLARNRNNLCGIANWPVYPLF